MKSQWYAEALYEALTDKNVKDESDAHKVFMRFRKVITARGHEKLLPFVARELEKIVAREKNKNETLLIVADRKSLNKWLHAYDHYERQGIIPPNNTRREIVDESVVGGFQIKTKDTLIDGSYKKTLTELYRKITN